MLNKYLVILDYNNGLRLITNEELSKYDAYEVDNIEVIFDTNSLDEANVKLLKLEEEMEAKGYSI